MVLESIKIIVNCDTMVLENTKLLTVILVNLELTDRLVEVELLKLQFSLAKKIFLKKMKKRKKEI